jgi:dihydrofolate synthase/folylpolyglutamate synthase
MFETYQQAVDWLTDELPRTTKGVFKDEDSLKRGEYLLQHLGSPHNKIKSIHVAGTSGKGGVASYASALLTEQGFKVGLNISPHTRFVNERIQINGQPISDEDFLALVNRIKPSIDDMSQSEIGAPSYFEAITTMALLYFHQKKIDYAVIEVGLGGTFDTTNLIKSEGKICVINKIAKDHVDILGEDLSDIAAQKAGIIKPNNRVIALSQSEQINIVIRNKAKLENAQLTLLDSDQIKIKNLSLNGTEFRSDETDYHLKMIGAYNASNFVLALKAVQSLADQDAWIFDDQKTTQAQALQLPFRFEVIKNSDKTYIFDGAHNLDKISTFLDSFNALGIDKNDVEVVFGYSRANDIAAVAQLIQKNFNSAVICWFDMTKSDIKSQALDTEKIRSFFDDDFRITKAQNVEAASDFINKSPQKTILVIGSFYLCQQFSQNL